MQRVNLAPLVCGHLRGFVLWLCNVPQCSYKWLRLCCNLQTPWQLWVDNLTFQVCNGDDLKHRKVVT
jgi:hypothetical protein